MPGGGGGEARRVEAVEGGGEGGCKERGGKGGVLFTKDRHAASFLPPLFSGGAPVYRFWRAKAKGKQRERQNQGEEKEKTASCIFLLFYFKLFILF